MEMANLPIEAKKIVAILIRDYRPKKIILFGSFAREESKPESDLDLCLIKEDISSAPAERRFEVYSLLHPRTIPVDVVVYRPEELEKRFSLGDPFVENLFSEGKVLYG